MGVEVNTLDIVQYRRMSVHGGAGMLFRFQVLKKLQSGDCDAPETFDCLGCDRSFLYSHREDQELLVGARQ